MPRRASAFATDLAELDNLHMLPLPSAPQQPETPDAHPSTTEHPASSTTVSSSPPDAGGQQLPPPDAPAAAAAPKSAQTGTRATQVRLPPQLAAWLGEEAHRTKKTLSTVVALAALEHRSTLPVRHEDPDGLDISRRVASGTVPVTLRLTGSQRQLLDEIAGEYAATRSAVVVAALTAVAPPHDPN